MRRVTERITVKWQDKCGVIHSGRAVQIRRVTNSQARLTPNSIEARKGRETK